VIHQKKSGTEQGESKNLHIPVDISSSIAAQRPAMQIRTVKSDILLLLTSIIWGFAFVAQRVGMDYVGPFLFNGIRFALGSASLLPLLYLNHKRGEFAADPPLGKVLAAGSLAGLALFAGASLQQIGIISTTAGIAG
jgi:drug/metabolite transporter (DMT)-like permease